MMQSVPNLPPRVVGVHASGVLQRADYAQVLNPLVGQDPSSAPPEKGRRLRLLYELGPDLRAITPPAVVEELRLHLGSLGTNQAHPIERCAVVSDSPLLRKITAVCSRVLPESMRVFPSSQRSEAIDWLARPATAPGTVQEYREELRVLTVGLKGTLQREDFDALTLMLNNLTEAGKAPVGMVIHVDALPHHADLGSLLNHLGFVQAFHKRFERIALVSEHRVMATCASLMLQKLVSPQVRNFDGKHLNSALAWAAVSQKAKPKTPHHGGNGHTHFDRVTEAGLESFPASDPPSYL